MTSLLSKLKDLVNASVRGPRRYKTKRSETDEAASEGQPVSEVTEAPARRRKVPEVTEATPVKIETAARPTASTPSQSAPQAKENEAEQAGDLEEGRVADLLKGEKP